MMYFLKQVFHGKKSRNMKRKYFTSFLYFLDYNKIFQEIFVTAYNK